MSRSIRPVLGALAAAALLAAGCGGSSNDAKPTAAKSPAGASAKASAPKSSGPVPSKAAYVKKADAICLEAQGISAKANVAVQKAYKSGSQKQVAAAIDQFAPQYAAKIKQLTTMTMPHEGDAHMLVSLLRVMTAQVTALQAESRALKENNQKMLKRVSEVQAQTKSFAQTLGQTYGFKVCGRSA